MAKEIYWERKFSKNKDGDSSFLPELQRRQNDNMAIPEIQYAVLWTLQRHTVVFGKPINRYHTPPKLIFRVKSGFYACMGRVGTPVVEYLSAHAPSEAHRISASFKQPGPGYWSRRPTNPSVTTTKAQLRFKGNRWTDILGVYVLGGYKFRHFGVFEQRSHGGNMAGTNTKLDGCCLVVTPDHRELKGLLK